MPAPTSWQFSVGGDTPAFVFYLIKFDPTDKRVVGTYLLWSLINLEGSLSVGNTVGELSATFGDQDNMFFATQADQPRAMDAIQLQLRNRHGQWGVAWTGLVDSISRSVIPGHGNTVTIKATSPIKKFEITAQRPGDVGGIALASLGGLKGSAILAYACQQSECNYPGELAAIPQVTGQSYALGTVVDLNVDAGAQNWGSISSGIFTNPTQQLWSAVIAAVQADSGVEWFADELGRVLWRRPGFLNVGPQQPRRILEEDIVSHTLTEGDQNLLTRIEVRYGNVPLVNNATVTGGTAGTPSSGVWVAPQEMINQLGYRNRVIYAPWVRSNTAAQSLATFLGQIYSANTLTGSVTIPADPLFTVGSVIEVPTLRQPTREGNAATAHYYITSVLYQLDWGNSWVMTLGLAYGRPTTDSFPYLSKIKWPVLSLKDKQDSLPQGIYIGSTGTDANNYGQLTDLFSFAATSNLNAGSSTAYTDAAVIPWGTEFYVSDPSNKRLNIYVAAQAPSGVTAPVGKNILIAAPVQTTTGYVTITADGISLPASNTGTSGGSVSQPTAQSTSTGNQTGGSSAASSTTSTTPVGRLRTFPVVGYSMRTIGIGQEYGQTNLSGTLPGGYLEYPYTEPDGTYHNNFHVGMDFSAPGSAANQSPPICAVASGKVVKVGWNNHLMISSIDSTKRGGLGDGSTVAGIGPHDVPLWDGYDVAIQSGNLIHNYGHLVEGSCPFKEGQMVSEGQNIGTMGATGYAHGIHLHFAIFDIAYQGWRNPRDYLPTGVTA